MRLTYGGQMFKRGVRNVSLPAAVHLGGYLADKQTDTLRYGGFGSITISKDLTGF